MNREILIVGGGPAGSIAALSLLRKGIRPTIIERAEFPRYHIGESLTGECGAHLRELGLESQMREHAYSVKRGVRIHAAEDRASVYVPVRERDATGGLTSAETWQVRRDDFDQMLLDHAVEQGAQLITGDVVAPILEHGRIRGVTINRAKKVEDLRADFAIDASGHRTFLARHGVTGPKHPGRYHRQVAAFSQITGATPDPDTEPGDTLLFRRQDHHWGWFIPLTQDIVSVGVVADGDHFRGRPIKSHEFLLQELLELNPAMRRRLDAPEFVNDVHTASSYSYRVDRFTGPGFMCIGDSHRFVDPIFSFGVFIAFYEARLAADQIVDYLSGTLQGDPTHPFRDYEQHVDRGQDIVESFINCFWDFHLAFLAFVNTRYVEDVVDIFAGRIYGDRAQGMGIVPAMCKLHEAHGIAAPQTPANDPR